MTATLAPTTSLLERTHDLLQHLAGLKADRPRLPDEGVSEHRRRLLHDPEVSAVVNEIITLNDTQIRKSIGFNRITRRIRESTDDLFSKVLTGGYADGGEVGGVMAAVLKYDVERGGVKAFPSYLRTAIGREFSFTEREKQQYRHVGSRTQSLSGSSEESQDRPIQWADERQESPSLPPERKELVAVVRDAIRFLPGRRKEVAEMMVNRMLDEGRWPTHVEVAEALGVTRQRGKQVGDDVMNRLRDVILERYPQLAAVEMPEGGKRGR